MLIAAQRFFRKQEPGESSEEVTALELSFGLRSLHPG